MTSGGGRVPRVGEVVGEGRVSGSGRERRLSRGSHKRPRHRKVRA